MATDLFLNGHRPPKHTSLCTSGVKHGAGGYVPRERGKAWKRRRLRGVPRPGGHRATDTARGAAANKALPAASPRSHQSGLLTALFG